ncbi:MAG: SurA N-terminal domain-containing protein [Elusimicrobia bacterium]|nr:SurA N-terminal domain-containing protein [Elusimicrobiota bacterium]
MQKHINIVLWVIIFLIFSGHLQSTLASEKPWVKTTKTNKNITTKAVSPEVVTNYKTTSNQQFIARVNHILETLRDSGTDVNASVQEEVKQQVSREMLIEELWSRQATKMGMVVTDFEVAVEIQNTPQFRKDGLYNPSLYRQIILGQFKMSPEEYELWRKKARLASKYKQFVFSTIKITPDELKESYLAKNGNLVNFDTNKEKYMQELTQEKFGIIMNDILRQLSKQREKEPGVVEIKQEAASNAAWKNLFIAQEIALGGNPVVAQTQLSSIETTYSNTSACGYAILANGDIFFAQGKYKEAEAQYSKLLPAGVKGLRPFALYNIAKTKEAAGELAAEARDKDLLSAFLAPEGHWALAHCYEATGNTTETKDAWNKAAGALSSIRGALQVYYGDHNGVFPIKLDELTVKPTDLTQNPYINEIPLITLPNHQGTDVVQYVDSNEISPNDFTDSGGFVYYGSKKNAKTWGTIIFNCTHKDASGKPLYEY